MSDPNQKSELASKFYYLNQFGFTKIPVTVDGGDEKLRRFAAALCNVSGADGEVTPEEKTFIEGYCSSKGYPQSIIDDIPKMCRAAESKSLNDVMGETKELLTMGTLKNSSRQIIYDAIRAAGADGLVDTEKEAIITVAKALGLTDVELDNILSLVEKEKALRDERIKLLFPQGHPCLPK
eukprot:CAMPEP_0183754072 /NCGR_PEP_ID=MMETSP0739-20130205/3343_1 /TAXON_ID=385413 /ORGANISM="Thalassiosira miniscula, Strain CCMP1093" /LENGTH=179 /DNA_ID=CAMNT_0025990675 /DNA_START=11 /DNA_END=550 /DNA_ORIENTATION=-